MEELSGSCFYAAAMMNETIHNISCVYENNIQKNITHGQNSGRPAAATLSGPDAGRRSTQESKKTDTKPSVIPYFHCVSVC